MEYRQLFVFLEGERDIKFFNKTTRGLFERCYSNIKIVPYRTKTKKQVKNFINTVSHHPDWDYIYLRDSDESPCVTFVLEKIKKSCNYVDINCAVIVVREIESWYLSGLDEEASRTLGIKEFKNTESISKEEFENLFPTNKPINIIIDDLLETWSYDIAIHKNKSLKYFHSKYGLA